MREYVRVILEYIGIMEDNGKNGKYYLGFKVVMGLFLIIAQSLEAITKPRKLNRRSLCLGCFIYIHIYHTYFEP